MSFTTANERATPLRSSGSRPHLSRDQVFHVLQTRRRRDALRFLLGADDPVPMSALTEAVAANECDTTIEELTPAQRQRVYISLYQSHLPKLDRMGVIEYDQERGIVRSTDLIETFEPYLEGRSSSDEFETAGGNARAAQSYYLGASVLSLGVLALAAFGQVAVSGFVLGGLVVGLFLFTSTVASRR